MAYFGEWLAQRRSEIGLGRDDIAKALGAPVQSVARWERGDAEPPTDMRDACWEVLRHDGEIPPLDPAPIGQRRSEKQIRKLETGGRAWGAPQTWLEQWAADRGTRIEEVLKAFGLSPALKYHWRQGKVPSAENQQKIAAFLEIPREVLEKNGWTSGLG